MKDSHKEMPADLVPRNIANEASNDQGREHTDDYMDWESRKLGGMIQIPGYIVNHLHPNAQVTPEIQVQISHDATTFKEIWGVMPW